MVNKDLYVIIGKEQHKAISYIKKSLGMRSYSDVARLCISVCHKLVFKELDVELFKVELEKIYGKRTINELIADQKFQEEKEKVEGIDRTQSQGLGFNRKEKDKKRWGGKGSGRGKRRNEDQVRAIRREHEEGKTLKALSEKYNVGQNTIWRIVKRMTYKDVE